MRYRFPASNRLALWFRFNEDNSYATDPDSDVIDSSGNGRDGSMQNQYDHPRFIPWQDSASTTISILGSSTTSPSALIQTGSAGFAWGGDDPCRVISSNAADWEATSWGSGGGYCSISVWVWWDAPTSRVINTGVNEESSIVTIGNGNVRLYIDDTTGYLTFKRIYTSQVGKWESRNPVPEKEWVHLAITYLTSDYPSLFDPTMYINGRIVPITEDTPGNGTPDAINSYGLIVSTSGTRVKTFSGIISDLAVWSHHDLKPSEARAIYNARYGTYKDSLAEDNLMAAMRLMNTGSQAGADPTEERANHGFYFDKNAGSITYGDW